MNRFQTVSRAALVGAATAALLLGGVGPAFAVSNEHQGDEAVVAQVLPAEERVTSESEQDQPEAEVPDVEAPDVNVVVEEPVQATESETPDGAAVPAEDDSEELPAADGTADDIVYTAVSGGSEAQSSTEQEETGGDQVEAAGAEASGNFFTGPRRKISGKVTLPAGVPTSWLQQISVGADCFNDYVFGGCGYDIKYNKSTGAFSMNVPVVQKGWSVIPGAYVGVADGSANLVQQSWGANCGVGTGKSTSAGSGELKNVNLPMCLGATITGKVANVSLVDTESNYVSVSAYVGGGLKQFKTSATVSLADGTYTLKRVPRVKNVVVTLQGGAYGSDQAWKATYDAKKATAINATSGSVSSINFTMKPGFSDVCIASSYCNKFYKEIMWMHDEGISTGIQTAGYYRPDYKVYAPQQNVTREAMSAFLYRISNLSGYKASRTPRFADVPKSHKFYKQIQWMGDTGVSTGTVRNGKRYFDPSQGVTREAMSAFLYRMDSTSGYKASKTPRFADVPKSHKFYKQIQWMGDTGLSTGTKRNGKTYYDPNSKVTREAMSAFLYRFEN